MSSEITILLDRYRNGDEDALDELSQVVYPELKAIARNRARGKSNLGATVLVNETFLKLLNGGVIKSEDRGQFFALSSTIMRRIIVDEVRYATATKRNASEITYNEAEVADPFPDKAETLLEIDRILEQLATENPQLAQVFECRYFAGFTTDETAEALGASSRTVERLWAEARRLISALISNNKS